MDDELRDVLINMIRDYDPRYKKRTKEEEYYGQLIAKDKKSEKKLDNLLLFGKYLERALMKEL